MRYTRQCITVMLLLRFIVVFSQNKGDMYRREGNLENAIEAYRNNFNKTPEDKNNTYNLACAFALIHQKDSAFKYLQKALINDNSLWVLADNDLLYLTDDKRWKLLEKSQLQKFQKYHTKLKKPKYAKELLRLIMKDQAYDYQFDMAKLYFMKNGKAPHWYYPLSLLKQETIKDNFSKMEDLIAQNGWPTYSSVGKIAADGPLLVINHHEKEAIRVKYLPRIKKACLETEGSCVEYAKIQDRVLVHTGKKQRYGMQFEYDENRNLVPLPIESPEYIDQRRKKIGLEPIKEYLKRKINYNWKVIQKESN